MLYNEERPRIFDEVVGQKYIVENIREQSKLNKFFSVYILSGQFGSGKTTVARIIKLAANCRHKDENGNPCLKCPDCISILNESTMDCIEIDGASNNGVDQIRELIHDSAYRPTSLTYKIYIVDEVHMLSKSAFNALLKTLEEPPEYCIYILCTTETEAIPFTVRSRAAKYHFGRIPSKVICSHLLNIANKRNINIDEEALKLIAKYSYGSMRDALGLLEQCTIYTSINVNNIMKLFGVQSNDSYFKLLNSIVKKEPQEVVLLCEELYSSSIEMSLVINDLLDILADAVVLSTTAARESIDNTEEYIVSVEQFCSLCTLETIFHISNELLDLKSEIRKDNSKSTILVKLLRITQNLMYSYDELISRITELEKSINNLMCGSSPIYKNKIHDDFLSTNNIESYNVSSGDLNIREDISNRQENQIPTVEEVEITNDDIESKTNNLISNSNDELEFDIFSFWASADSNSNIPVKACEKELVTIMKDETKKEASGRIENLTTDIEPCEHVAEKEEVLYSHELAELKSDEIVAAALKGCNIEPSAEAIKIKTKFSPLAKILNSHIFAKKLNTISVEIENSDSQTSK